MPVAPRAAAPGRRPGIPGTARPTGTPRARGRRCRRPPFPPRSSAAARTRPTSLSRMKVPIAEKTITQRAVYAWTPSRCRPPPEIRPSCSPAISVVGEDADQEAAGDAGEAVRVDDAEGVVDVAERPHPADIPHVPSPSAVQCALRRRSVVERGHEADPHQLVALVGPSLLGREDRAWGRASSSFSTASTRRRTAVISSPGRDRCEVEAALAAVEDAGARLGAHAPQPRTTPGPGGAPGEGVELAGRDQPAARATPRRRPRRRSGPAGARASRWRWPIGGCRWRRPGER